MKKISVILGLALVAAAFLPSCKKPSSSSTPPKVSTPPYQVGQPIAAGNVAAGTYKGTMTTGNTYTLTGDFVINPGDTVLIQPGVHVCVANGVSIIVRGVLLSLGTQSNQNYITSCSTTPIDILENASNAPSDPAFSGKWTGINCDTTCTLLDIQWTHMSFMGAAFAVTEPCNGCTAGTTSFGIFFQNPKGDFILTDSYMYGSVDDAIRMAQGRIYIARNTFEKMGYVGGDGCNAKHGTQGDMCFNLCIGDATNTTKASDKGSGSGPECNINMYNNTYVDCGYRQASYSSRGSDVDFEQNARGLAYNNLMVNCRNGIRVGDGQNGIPVADTANLKYTNNYIYADSLMEVDQFYPVIAGTYTKANAYIIPTAVQLSLPVGFYAPATNPNGGDDLTYNSPACVAANNPMFVNFPLPEPITAGYNLSSIASLETGVAIVGSNYDFHLKAGSPAIGQGYTAFVPFANIANPVTTDVTKAILSTWITPPGMDCGAFQMNGQGNLH